MTGLLIITGPGASPGFRLAGFDVVEADGPEAAVAVLQGVRRDGKAGLVVVDDRLLEGVSDAILRGLRRKGLPVIVRVRVPERWDEREAGESEALRLIRRAIGYQIKIRR